MSNCIGCRDMTDSKEKLKRAKNEFYDSLQYNPPNKRELAEEYKTEIMNRIEYLNERLQTFKQKKAGDRSPKIIEVILTELEQLDNEMEKLPLLVE